MKMKTSNCVVLCVCFVVLGASATKGDSITAADAGFQDGSFPTDSQFIAASIGEPYPFNPFIGNDLNSGSGANFFPETGVQNANDAELDFANLTFIPEPMTVAMLGLGALPVLMRRRRKA